MKFAAIFPTTEIGNDPIVIRDFAQTAEELGYSTITTYEHVLGAVHANRDPKLPGPYTENDAFHEPFTLFGYLAAVTKSIKLSTAILILPQRQTVLVAKQCAELAVLSQDRFILGIGTGWNPVEYESLGEAWKTRGARLNEQLEVIQRLWSEPVIDFKGKYHRIDRAGILPRPAKPIPLWFGGMSDAALDRAVRMGSGYFAMGTGQPAQDRVKALRDKLEQAHRGGEAFDIDIQMNFARSPQEWHAIRAEWEKLGLTQISMRAMSTGMAWAKEPAPGFTSPQQHIDALETFMREMSD